jgi:hypothetical protein
MKQLRIAVVFASLMILACAACAWGYGWQVAENDRIKVTGSNGTTGGGAFTVKNLSNNSMLDYTTFCIEFNENLSYNTEYIVKKISDRAYDGGVGGQDGQGGDPLSNATKWLFFNYVKGTLDDLGLGFQYNSAGSDSLQRAIWRLENEISSTTDNLANTLYTKAMLYDKYDSFDDCVAVMHLEKYGDTTIQDLLVADTSRDIPPVPEPSTLLLTGLGLVGVAYLRRKRKG